MAVPEAIHSLISAQMLRKCHRGGLNYTLADSRAAGQLLNAILYYLSWIELLRTRCNPKDDKLVQNFRLLDYFILWLCSLKIGVVDLYRIMDLFFKIGILMICFVDDFSKKSIRIVSFILLIRFETCGGVISVDWSTWLSLGLRQGLLSLPGP